ncbi:hypothetical protein [Aliamphritea ceti]|uniref:hypothetical protein n=1 Tax=Aliamphritea ceti TaxID=1524258 RepID=UPI0021C46C8D|nr:hypothetical protein [Aliamphritea ceti]
MYKSFCLLIVIFISCTVNAADCSLYEEGEKVVINNEEYDVNKTLYLYLDEPEAEINLKDYLSLKCLGSIAISAKDVNIDSIGGFRDLISLNVDLVDPRDFSLTLGEISKINNLKTFGIVVDSKMNVSFENFPKIDALNSIRLNTKNMDLSFLDKVGYLHELILPSKGIDYSLIPESVNVKMLVLSSIGPVYKADAISTTKAISINGNISYVFIDDSGFVFDRLKDNNSIKKILVHDKREPAKDVILSMSALKEYGTSSVYGYGGEKWYKGGEISLYFGEKNALASSTSVKGFVTSFDAGAGYINDNNKLVYADKLTLSKLNKCGSNNIYISTRLLGLDIEEYKKVVYTLIDRREKVEARFTISGCSTGGALISALSLQKN